jgi:hypothetical protein
LCDRLHIVSRLHSNITVSSLAISLGGSSWDRDVQSWQLRLVRIACSPRPPLPLLLFATRPAKALNSTNDKAIFEFASPLPKECRDFAIQCQLAQR